MEYAYAALLLHESGEELNEDNISRVLESAKVEVEESRVKALVAALENVNIEEAINSASAGEVAGQPAGTSPEPELEAEDEPDDEVEAEDGEEPSDGEEDEDIGDLFG